MPLLESITGYNIVRTPVVFDIGSAYTKCGYAGDISPSSIISSSIVDSKTGKVRFLSEFADEDDLQALLKQFINKLFFQCCLVGAKDRSVVICESVLCTTLFRQNLAKVLFEHFEVNSVMFAPHHALSLLPLAISTGLILDVGYTESLVIPVYEGTSLMKALHAAPLASSAIHRNLESLLRQEATLSSNKSPKQRLSDVIEHLEEKILEDMKVRCCFITNIERARLIQRSEVSDDQTELPSPPNDMKYPLDGDVVITVPGSVRERACEILFHQNSSEATVATLILDSLLQSPIDCRKALAENIVIIGGTARVPGFYPRLLSELKNLLDHKKYKQNLAIVTFKFHQPFSKENYTAWLGGSIMGDLENLSARSISRESYLANNKLPDWCVLSERMDSLYV